ncbi:MAG: methionyl-tRNA formyltransferase [Gammaproteobacteria bacterium]|jgi:methionyl-tRNA formyltransferase
MPDVHAALDTPLKNTYTTNCLLFPSRFRDSKNRHEGRANPLSTKNRSIARQCKTVFAGTPEFSVASLRVLDAHPEIELVGVYTQPDRPSGRGRREKLSPIKLAASELSIPVFQPSTLKDETAIEQFRELAAELLVVAAYGLILPRAVLELPKLALNVHASLLPRWRGAAPIQRAIMADDGVSGVSMMRVVEALDAGPVLMKRSCPIESSDTGGSLHDKLANLGAQCLRLTVDEFLNGKLGETPQDESAVVYAEKITSADRVLDWQLSAQRLACQIRALNPSPVSTAKIGSLDVKVWAARALQNKSKMAPGAIIATSDDGIDVATGNGVLRITQLQPAGKRSMTATEFVNGFRQMLGTN